MTYNRSGQHRLDRPMLWVLLLAMSADVRERLRLAIDREQARLEIEEQPTEGDRGHLD